MAMGKRPAARQASPMWVETSNLPTSDGHPYFERLNRVLADSGFDAFVEELCAAFYADRLGRPSLRPGRYFRMLFIGYFEGLTPLYVKIWGIHVTGVARRRGCPQAVRRRPRQPQRVPTYLRRRWRGSPRSTAGDEVLVLRRFRGDGEFTHPETPSRQRTTVRDRAPRTGLRLSGYPSCQEMLSVVVAIRTIVERCTQSRRHLR